MDGFRIPGALSWEPGAGEAPTSGPEPHGPDLGAEGGGGVGMAAGLAPTDGRSGVDLPLRAAGEVWIATSPPSGLAGAPARGSPWSPAPLGLPLAFLLRPGFSATAARDAANPEAPALGARPRGPRRRPPEGRGGAGRGGTGRGLRPPPAAAPGAPLEAERWQWKTELCCHSATVEALYQAGLLAPHPRRRSPSRSTIIVICLLSVFRICLLSPPLPMP